MQQPTTAADAQIKQRVEAELIDEHITGISVLVQDGVVTLEGTVASLWARVKAVEEAREADNVRDVVSTLTIRRAESDAAIARQIAERLHRYALFTIFDDVAVDVRDGVAALTGSVTMPFKAHAIVKLASRADGVQDVQNGIDALPVSVYDDRIRYAVASRIYNDSMFWHYAIQANPPIHIIVSGGRVLLTGVVASEVERRKAETLAREAFGIVVLENKLRIES